MTQSRLRTGARGEEVACERLREAGYVIVARNVRTRLGELDLIVADPATLVFVEVKAMRAGALAGPERPVLAVGIRKQVQLRRLARAWLGEAEAVPRRPALRFDVVGVRLAADGSVLDYEHIEGAF